MPKRLYRYVPHVRGCWLGTEQRQSILLDSDVNCNRRFYGNWSHYSLCTDSTKWVLYLLHAACFIVYLSLLISVEHISLLCQTHIEGVGNWKLHCDSKSAILNLTLIKQCAFAVHSFLFPLWFSELSVNTIVVQTVDLVRWTLVYQWEWKW